MPGGRWLVIVVLPTLLFGREVLIRHRRHTETRPVPHKKRIANIKWQDMIPNTEVLQRCAQNGNEERMMHAQLRWTGRLVSTWPCYMEKWMPVTEYGKANQRDTMTCSSQRWCHITCSTMPWRPPRRTVSYCIVYATPVIVTLIRCAKPRDSEETETEDHPASIKHRFICVTCLQQTLACIVTTKHMLLAEVEISHAEADSIQMLQCN